MQVRWTVQPFRTTLALWGVTHEVYRFFYHVRVMYINMYQSKDKKVDKTSSVQIL